MHKFLITATILGYLAAGAAFRPALAYTDGTYLCKNSAGGENSYKFETVSIGGANLPLVKAELRYVKNPEDKNSPVLQSTVQGIATIATNSEGVELLSLNNLRFEFVQGELSHCKK